MPASRPPASSLAAPPPKALTSGPRVDDQSHLTDDEAWIMPVAGGGFEQCYNAQAMVDPERMLVVVPKVVQAVNDQQPVLPLLAQLQALPAGLNGAKRRAAAAGSFSKDNVAACDAAGIEPLIAVTRDQHHPHGSGRFREPPALAPTATPVERMTNRLKTGAGRAAYALRKQTVEPVFGIIKSVMGFRQFLTRGLDNVQGEWTLVCLAWNLKRMAVLRPQYGESRVKLIFARILIRPGQGHVYAHRRHGGVGVVADQRAGLRRHEGGAVTRQALGATAHATRRRGQDRGAGPAYGPARAPHSTGGWGQDRSRCSRGHRQTGSSRRDDQLVIRNYTYPEPTPGTTPGGHRE